jgi:hypothetical protein
VTEKPFFKSEEAIWIMGKAFCDSLSRGCENGGYEKPFVNINATYNISLVHPFSPPLGRSFISTGKISSAFYDAPMRP